MKPNCENIKNRWEYIPPVLCLMAFAIEEGFAVSEDPNKLKPKGTLNSQKDVAGEELVVNDWSQGISDPAANNNSFNFNP